jgi:3-dehydrotetronate 4-kinase
LTFDCTTEGNTGPVAEALMDELKADFAIVSGSCSTATQAQVAAFTAAGGKAFAIDPLRLAAGDDPVRQALAWRGRCWARSRCSCTPLQTPTPSRACRTHWAHRAPARWLKAASRAWHRGLCKPASRKWSWRAEKPRGRVCRRPAPCIGAQIDPGVPWCYAPTQRIHPALKSGTFGRADFFNHAFTALT